jgi:hypothetical protein
MCANLLIIYYGHMMNLTSFPVLVSHTHREFACQAEPCVHSLLDLQVWENAGGEISWYHHAS